MSELKRPVLKSKVMVAISEDNFKWDFPTYYKEAEAYIEQLQAKVDVMEDRIRIISGKFDTKLYRELCLEVVLLEDWLDSGLSWDEFNLAVQLDYRSAKKKYKVNQKSIRK